MRLLRCVVFLFTLGCDQVGLATKEGSPIIHARVSGNFAFVECRSVEETTSLLNLNNIPFLGKVWVFVRRKNVLA